jgi:sporulation protein YlmC with PRC-barrel domain
MKTTLAAVTALMIAVSPVAAQTTAQAPVSFVGKQNTSEVLGSDFIGTPVTTKDGQQIGKISNLVFDQEGRIELAVIGVGGFLGIGEKEVAVPFDAIKPETVNNKNIFIVDATKDELKTAPAYQTLNAQAFNQRMADWRVKATQSWADIKSRAAKAYDEAKQRVEETRQPGSEQQK